MCTFKTLSTLASHLSRNHKAEVSSSAGLSQEHVSKVTFKCPLCTFEEPFSESGVFYHLRRHLKNHETVVCPYNDCNYSTNVTSTFNSHKSRQHQSRLASDFCCYTIRDEHVQSLPGTSSEVASEEVTSEHSPDPQTEKEDAQWDTDRLKDQLKHNAASLFLKMQAILHVSNKSTASGILEDYYRQIQAVCFVLEFPSNFLLV